MDFDQYSVEWFPDWIENRIGNFLDNAIFLIFMVLGSKGSSIPQSIKKPFLKLGVFFNK